MVSKKQTICESFKCLFKAPNEKGLKIFWLLEMSPAFSLMRAEFVQM